MFHDVRAVGPFFKNGFVLADEDTLDAVIIDPGDEVDELLEIVERHRFQVRYILLTHAHIDHVTGVARAKAALGAPIGLHRDDLFLYERAPEIGKMYGMQVAPLPPVDFYFDDEGPWRFGRFAVHVHHTPGHCPGGVCLEVRDTSARPSDGVEGAVPQLFVGDTLFAGSIGRTDLPGGHHPTLIASIKTVLFAFGDHAVVYPGHGEATTIGEERRTNPFLV
jgi:glyoxylase-like metal-dependent hydrolase (beta-lactamase superfamily II)